MKIFATVASIALGVVTANAKHVKRELILSGTEVPQGTKTYMSSIRSTIGGDTVCGGVLITPTHVLTTASCTAYESITNVVVGTHYNNGTIDGETFMIVSAQNHSNYHFETTSYDFAVLTLDKASSITPVQLPATDLNIVSGTSGEAFGWGWTKEDNSSNSYELLSVDLQFWDNSDCGIVFDGYMAVDESMVCAGGITNEGVCTYDGGDPIVIENGSDDVVVGLVSWGYGCGLQGTPTAFARVSAAVDWINYVTQTSSNDSETSSGSWSVTQSSSNASSITQTSSNSSSVAQTSTNVANDTQTSSSIQNSSNETQTSSSDIQTSSNDTKTSSNGGQKSSSVVQKSSSVTQKSSSATQTYSSASQTYSSAGQTSSDGTKQSSSATQQSSNVSQKSSNETQKSSNETQQSSNVSQKSSSKTQQSSSETQQSSSETQQSSSETQQSSSKTQQSSSETQQSSNVTQMSSNDTQQSSSATQKYSSVTSSDTQKSSSVTQKSSQTSTSVNQN